MSWQPTNRTPPRPIARTRSTPATQDPSPESLVDRRRISKLAGGAQGSFSALARFCIIDKWMIGMPRGQPHRALGYYLRDDGELMIEVTPGEFVSETAARRGLVHPSVLTDIHRIKGRLRRRR